MSCRHSLWPCWAEAGRPDFRLLTVRIHGINLHNIEVAQTESHSATYTQSRMIACGPRARTSMPYGGGMGKVLSGAGLRDATGLPATDLPPCELWGRGRTAHVRRGQDG